MLYTHTHIHPSIIFTHETLIAANLLIGITSYTGIGQYKNTENTITKKATGSTCYLGVSKCILNLMASPAYKNVRKHILQFGTLKKIDVFVLFVLLQSLTD